MCENCQQQSCRAFIGLTIHAKMIGARRPFYLKFWVKVTAFERNRRFSIYFRPYRLSRNILQKSSINTIRKFTTRFPMSLRWSSYVVPTSRKGGSKTQNGRFSSDITLCLKKVCYKVYSCKYCQQQSCRAFIGLTIHAKIIGGEVQDEHRTLSLSP